MAKNGATDAMERLALAIEEIAELDRSGAKEVGGFAMTATVLQGTRHNIETSYGHVVEVDNYQPASKTPTPAQKFEGLVVSMFAAFESDVMPYGVFTDPQCGFADSVKKNFSRKEIKHFLKRLEERRIVRSKVFNGTKFLILANPPFVPDPSSPFAVVNGVR